MSTIDYSGARWRKTRRSNGEGSCIEVATVEAGTAGRIIAVRDSKDPGGPKLPVSRAAWARFTTHIKTET